jgi:hypothetical protein
MKDMPYEESKGQEALVLLQKAIERKKEGR